MVIVAPGMGWPCDETSPESDPAPNTADGIARARVKMEIRWVKALSEVVKQAYVPGGLLLFFGGEFGLPLLSVRGGHATGELDGVAVDFAFVLDDHLVCRLLLVKNERKLVCVC